MILLNMAANIILTPFWSAFTDAYIKRDYNWMRGTLEKLGEIGYGRIKTAA